jgi:hypothetical protein
MAITIAITETAQGSSGLPVSLKALPGIIKTTIHLLNAPASIITVRPPCQTQRVTAKLCSSVRQIKKFAA